MAWWDRDGYSSFGPRTTAGGRRSLALREKLRLEKQGIALDPVCLEGRAIARTFWGKAWCDNLEGYSDFENRLPRGRTYVRSGSVIDLRIERGKIAARVQGSSLYEVDVAIQPIEKKRWAAVVSACSGGIGTLVELLRGSLPAGVMRTVCARDTGLFPAPREIAMTCSCPDYATLCKHVAAVLYGVGARLDERPALLFELRGVDPSDLVETAAKAAVQKAAPAREKGRRMDLASVFGIELAAEEDSSVEEPEAPRRRRQAAKVPTKKKRT